MDASVQCYSCGDFIEVETLGPLVTLGTGESTTHRETWTLARVDPDAPMDAVLAERDSRRRSHRCISSRRVIRRMMLG